MRARSARIPTVHLPFERFRLRCGATLLVSPRESAPVTAIQLHVRGGHSLDPPGREGTAWLAGALLDQGTDRHTEEEISDSLEPGGGSVRGDATGVRGTIASREWKLLLDRLAEMVVSPSYPKAKVERQRGRLIERLLVERDDPRSQAARSFRRLVYGDHWLGRVPYGTLESVARIDRRALRAHHAKHWVASRAVVAVCGDVEPEEVRRALDRRLARWRTGEQLPSYVESFPEPATRLDAHFADRQQVHVFLGHLGIRRKDPLYPAVVVLDHVLGTGPGFTNRLAGVLRDRMGLAYAVDASSYPSAGLLRGSFTAYIGTSPRHVGTAIEVFLREMRRIRDEPVGTAELELAKSYLIGSFPLGFERASRRAAYLVNAERLELPGDNLERLPREFAAVTAEDVQRAARAVLRPDAPCIATGGPIDAKALAELLPAAASRRRGRARSKRAARRARR